MKLIVVDAEKKEEKKPEPEPEVSVWLEQQATFVRLCASRPDVRDGKGHHILELSKNGVYMCNGAMMSIPLDALGFEMNGKILRVRSYFST